MRLIIAGGLKGQIIAAAKIAMSHGAAVTHTEGSTRRSPCSARRALIS